MGFIGITTSVAVVQADIQADIQVELKYRGEVSLPSPYGVMSDVVT